jgi:hypothetical protein
VDDRSRRVRARAKREQADIDRETAQSQRGREPA